MADRQGCVLGAGRVASHDFPRADSLDPAGADRQPGGAAVAERRDPVPVVTAVVTLPWCVEREPRLPGRYRSG